MRMQGMRPPGAVMPKQGSQPLVSSSASAAACSGSRFPGRKLSYQPRPSAAGHSAGASSSAACQPWQHGRQQQSWQRKFWPTSALPVHGLEASCMQQQQQHLPHGVPHQQHQPRAWAPQAAAGEPRRAVAPGQRHQRRQHRTCVCASDPNRGGAGAGTSTSAANASAAPVNGTSWPPRNGASWPANGASRPAANGAPPPPPPPPPPPGGAAAAASRFTRTDWGWSGADEDWDPAQGLAPKQLADLDAEYEYQAAQRRAAADSPRDKWITPLLDWQDVVGAFDPDQTRTEDGMTDEALTNKSESRTAAAFVARLVLVPLAAGALISRTLTGPILSFTSSHDPAAFAMTPHQKLEGAERVHVEEMRVRMDVAIGRAPPLNEDQMLVHLREFALEVQEEERHHNEANLITLVSDSISGAVMVVMLARDVEGRSALFSTVGRLFEGLSDIAKAVLIILVADTLLGYHSEEGWTGLIDVVLGHYGVEAEENSVVLFVGIIPIAIDVLFKYWIFIGLNKISPGAVVTIKQLDRH